MVLHFRRSSLEHQSISIERSVQFSNYCDQNTIQTEIVFIFEGLMSLNKGKEKNIPVVYFDLSKPTDKIRCILRWWWPDQHVLVPFNFYDSVENVIFFGLWLYDSRKDTRAMKHIFFQLERMHLFNIYRRSIICRFILLLLYFWFDQKFPWFSGWRTNFYCKILASADKGIATMRNLQPKWQKRNEFQKRKNEKKWHFHPKLEGCCYF